VQLSGATEPANGSSTAAIGGWLKSTPGRGGGGGGGGGGGLTVITGAVTQNPRQAVGVAPFVSTVTSPSVDSSAVLQATTEARTVNRARGNANRTSSLLSWRPTLISAFGIAHFKKLVKRPIAVTQLDDELCVRNIELLQQPSKGVTARKPQVAPGLVLDTRVPRQRFPNRLRTHLGGGHFRGYFDEPLNVVRQL
jgi:hypothetical protein